METMAEPIQAEAGPESRRGRPRSEQAHQKVLQATSRLLQETPYDELTIERIATAAGVGKQTIYRWWKNKAEVVLEALLTGQAEIDLVPMPDTGDLDADLRGWMRAMVNEGFTDEHIAMARSLLSAGLQCLPTIEELIQRENIWDSGAVAERLRRAVRAGELRSSTDVSAAASALADPLVFRMMTGKKPDAVWAEALVDTILNGIRPQDPTS